MGRFTDRTPAKHLRSGYVAAMLNWLTRAFEAPADQTLRHAQIVALQSKSDDELTRMGLPRDQIASHVYRDLFYA